MVGIPKAISQGLLHVSYSKQNDIHEKKRIAHNNINIFHSYENKTQKILTCMYHI